MITDDLCSEGANLVDLLAEGDIVPDMRATNRWEAIEELIDHLAHTGKIRAEDQAALSALVKRRESAMSSGIGSGIAIPTASADFLSEVVLVLGRSKAGCEFDALDSEPVNFVFLAPYPEGQFHKRLDMVASIGKLLCRADVRQALIDAEDAASMWRVIRDQNRLINRAAPQVRYLRLAAA